MGSGEPMKTWLEYRGEYVVTGDKVYVERIQVDAPLHTFPFYELMEPPRETWSVYGPVIRAFLSQDWGTAGHHYIYPFIRTFEMWIDQGVPAEDRAMVYLRYTIGWWLMKETKLDFLEADTIGKVYSTDWRVERIRRGEVPLQTFYTKKANHLLKYIPPTPGKIRADQRRRNRELEDIQTTRKTVMEKRDSYPPYSPYWDQILSDLDRAAEDLMGGSGWRKPGSDSLI